MKTLLISIFTIAGTLGSAAALAGHVYVTLDHYPPADATYDFDYNGLYASGNNYTEYYIGPGLHSIRYLSTQGNCIEGQTVAIDYNRQVIAFNPGCSASFRATYYFNK